MFNERVYNKFNNYHDMIVEMKNYRTRPEALYHGVEQEKLLTFRNTYGPKTQK